ncbi:MAG: ribosomal protein S18-alanine N-acetyltransferase [Thermodesulfobacteria bacterium]|nr:ribosomal protein S18-alanine N-acetyltransferase [Thermodesulfobacteriota bacterium]
MFCIREAKEDELLNIAELEKLVFGSHAWTLSQLMSEWITGLSKFILAFVNSKLVGYLIFRQVDEEAEILRLGVKKEFRRKGIGEKLLKKAEELVITQGGKVIYLEVRKSNEPAINFYKKQNFSIVSVRKNYYPDGEDALIMRKVLKN